MKGILAFLLLAALQTAEAQPPSRARSPFSRRVWQSADGLPEDFAQALARTPDGYLWIGTSGGLVRFDGVRFAVFNHENQPAFRDDSFYSLWAARDGTLWGGTEGGGLVRYRAGSFQVFGAAEGLTNGFVRVIYEDSRGKLWVGTDSGLFQMNGESLVRIDGRNDIPRISVHAICEDRQGRLLVGGIGLLVLDGRRAVSYASSDTLADNSIRTILQASDGAVWIGTISGLRRLPHGVEGNPFATPRTISGVNIDYLLESRRHELWIGTYGQGVLRWENGRITSMEAPVWLPHNNVLALFDDGEDDIWVGTQGGLLRLSPSAAVTVTTPAGSPQIITAIYHGTQGPLLVTDLNGRLYRVGTGKTEEPTLLRVPLPPSLDRLPVRNVFRDSKGNLWIGTDGQGVARISSNGTAQFTMRQGLVNDFVRAFCEDRDGSIWIGTDGALSRWHDGRFENFDTSSGLVYASIRVLFLDRDGDLWVGTDGGLSRYRAGSFVADPVLNRLRGLKVWAIHQDSTGAMWIGTHGDGLFRLQDGRLSRFTTQQGLPNNKIHFIAEDSGQNLWMSGTSGIVSIARRDLEQLSAKSKVALRVYGTSEGLDTNQMNGGVQPAGARTAAGDLWFASAKGAVHIQPGASSGSAAPPVLIEQVVADGREIPPANEVHLPPGDGRLEIRYTAIRLRSPETTHFKYWMEGLEREWNDAGQRRTAYYTNVPPAKYRFHVVAYEINDPNHAAERILTIEWRPPFYKTGWFLSLCALSAGAAAFGAYRVRVRNIRQRFAAVLEERNRLAREMHDTLIQGCAGVSALLEAASHAREVSPGVSHELLDRARDEVRAAVDDARDAVWNLRRPGTGEDLVQAISHLTRRIGLESGVAADFQSSGPPASLGAESERSLLLLVREALQNAVRHGSPKHLRVSLSFERNAVSMRVEDDGSGFDTGATDAPSHYGLVGMRERARELHGSLDLTSTPGTGTRVRLTIPTRPAGFLQGLFR